MSVAREVKLNYDLNVLEAAARELGYLTTRGGAARGWYGSMQGAEKCDLVITSKQHRFDMGFVKQSDGSVKMYADYHGGHVQQDMAEKIIPRYLERATNGRMKVTQRKMVENKVELRLERR